MKTAYQRRAAGPRAGYRQDSPRASPSASMTALTAPADAPDMPSIVSRPSSSRWSSTPQVNAPSAPPPCSARLMRLPAFGFSDLSPPNARERNSIIACVSLRDPAAVDRIGRAGHRLRRIAAQKHGERADTLRLCKLMHRLLLGQKLDSLLLYAVTGSLGARVDLLLHKRREHPARTDGIARHTIVRGFHRNHLGEADETMLGGDVGNLLRAGDQSVCGSNIDDAAPFAFLHAGQCGADRVERGGQVDRNDRVPFLDREILDVRDVLDAGV